jgi:hypothetical protein
MPGVRSYRDLKVWQKGMDLVVETYQLTKLFFQERTIWVDEPNPKSGCVGSRQHC